MNLQKNWAIITKNTGDWKPMHFNMPLKEIDISGIKDRNASGEIGIEEKKR